jgi:hypothetical protein
VSAVEADFRSDPTDYFSYGGGIRLMAVSATATDLDGAAFPRHPAVLTP